MTLYDSSVLIEYLDDNETVVEYVEGNETVVEYVEGHLEERAVVPQLVLFEVYQGGYSNRVRRISMPSIGRSDGSPLPTSTETTR